MNNEISQKIACTSQRALQRKHCPIDCKFGILFQMKRTTNAENGKSRETDHEIRHKSSSVLVNAILKFAFFCKYHAKIKRLLRSPKDLKFEYL